MKPVKCKAAFAWWDNYKLISFIGFTITKIADNTTTIICLAISLEAQKILSSSHRLDLSVKVNTHVTQATDWTYIDTLQINRFYLSINTWRDD